MSTHPHQLTLPNRPHLLKVPDVAALLNVKPRTIYEMVAQGRIPYRQPPGSNILRFDLEEIVEWTKAGIKKGLDPLMLLPCTRSLGGCNLKENTRSVYKRGTKGESY